MIHDLLLSVFDTQSETLAIEKHLNSEALKYFIHPGEKRVIEDIIKIIQQYREIAKFSKKYGATILTDNKISNDDNFQKGLYIQAFAVGIEIVSEKFLDDISELERRYVKLPTQTALFIYHQLYKYESLFLYLQKLINGIRMQKFHGCNIMQYIHQNMLHGNELIISAIATIQKMVSSVFLKQLAHWMLYGKFLDAYGEFFIQSVSDSPRSVTTNLGNNSSGSITGEETVDLIEIWRYEICYDMLPYYFSASWAEKVLFVGQTVLMFKRDINKKVKKPGLWNDFQQQNEVELCLWNDKQYEFFEKIKELEGQSSISVSQYEIIVDDIKKYVTERLSQIAIDQADLIKQLKLIKEYYLLGRGELYLEFIKRISAICKKEFSENNVREIVHAFETAVHSVNISDDLEKFSFEIPKTFIESEEIGHFGYLEKISLNYKIQWPLQLLFSPKVMDRYNELLRFLLLIKKTQYELHSVWYNHRRLENLGILQLRNQLIFLIDNLQHYIHIDVIESQFSVLMNTVLNSSDFEYIQKAQSIFQANILSCCFLLPADEPVKNQSDSTIEIRDNPVLSILNKLFLLCEEFCNFVTTTTENSLSESSEDELNVLEKQLTQLIEILFSLLLTMKAAPSSTPLSQLLLRMDFNHWFSRRT